VRVVPQSQAFPLSRVRMISSVDTSYPTRTVTTVTPLVSDGCFDITSQPPRNVLIVPFGQGANDDTFLMRVLGWRKCGPLYVPLDLFEGTVTLGAMHGTGSWIATSTIAATSNGVALPVGTIYLASTSGFTTSGAVLINTSNGPPQIVNYTGITGNALTGCTGGNGSQSNGQVYGTLATGGTVSQWGVSGNAVTSNDFLADTITASIGNNDYDYLITSPANDQIAHLRLDTKGCYFIEPLFDRNSSATQCNALVCML
jgi:hypothetical protein